MTTSNPISRRVFLSRGAATGGVILVGAGASAGLAGCSSGSSGSSTTTGANKGGKAGVSTGTPKRGGKAVIGTTADIDGFFPPTNHWDNNGFLYANTIYDPLTAVAADGSIKPYLAETITPNSTYTAWTLKLRSGITFHDGSPLTAAVVKANFDALKASALTGIALKQVTSVTITDPLTVVYNFADPFVSLPASLATQVGYVVGQAMLDAASKSPMTPPHPVGTGPFIYDNWQPNDHFTATRNPHYWRSGFPSPRFDYLPAHPRHHPTGGDPQDQRRGSDPVGRPGHRESLHRASPPTRWSTVCPTPSANPTWPSLS